MANPQAHSHLEPTQTDPMSLGFARQPSQRLRASRLWSIRQEFPRSLAWALSALSVVLLLLVWSVISYGGWIKPLFLPTPTAVIQAGIELLTQASLLNDIWASSLRVFWGFGLSAIIGVPIGIAMGTFASLNSFFGPIVSLARYMPIVAFVPLIIIWTGIGELSKVVIIFLALVLYNTLMVADAVKFIPDEMINVAYTLGGRRRDVLLRVIFPAALPSILDTLRVNVSAAWNFLVVAELIAAEKGLGFRILQSQRFLQTDRVIFCVILIGAIGWLIDSGLQRLSQAIAPWADQSRQG